VIIGGGYAGTIAAMKLEDKFNVTLVDTKSYFEFTPSRLRTVIEPQHIHKTHATHKSFLENTKVIEQPVTSVTVEQVVIGSGYHSDDASSGVATHDTVTKTIDYDYLIICSGSRCQVPVFPSFSGNSLVVSNTNPTIISTALHPSNIQPYNIEPPPLLIPSCKIVTARAQYLHRYYEDVHNAQQLLVIGGGTVGVELAAELIEKFPGKSITIVHSQQQLIHRSPERAIRHIESWMRKKGVTLILGEKIIAQQGIYFKTSKEVIIEANIAFICTGNIPNSDFLVNSCYSDGLNRSGFIRVNAHLQLHNHSNVFVAGDLTDIPEEEEKLCQTADAEISVVINNIQRREQLKPLVTYNPKPHPMLISLGKHDGVLIYRGYTIFTGLLPAIMKEFVEWKEMVFYRYPRLWKKVISVTSSRKKKLLKYQPQWKWKDNSKQISAYDNSSMEEEELFVTGSQHAHIV